MKKNKQWICTICYNDPDEIHSIVKSWLDDHIIEKFEYLYHDVTVCFRPHTHLRVLIDEYTNISDFLINIRYWSDCNLCCNDFHETTDEEWECYIKKGVVTC